jgi:hypothetical protein
MNGYTPENTFHWHKHYLPRQAAIIIIIPFKLRFILVDVIHLLIYEVIFSRINPDTDGGGYRSFFIH